MIIIWGTRLYGKTDEVGDELFYVATKFFHAWYLPLIPLGSVAVLEETEDGWHGVDIGFNFKSLVLGWLRAALVIFAIVQLGIAFFDSGAQFWSFVNGGLALAGLIATKMMPSFTTASYQRACELADILGANHEMRQYIEVAYGRQSAAAMPKLEEQFVDAASESSPGIARPLD